MRFDRAEVYHCTVEFEDVDSGGAVHHPNYFRFVERARIRSLAAAGCPFDELMRNGAMFVVADLDAVFSKPMVMGMDFAVVSRVIAVRRSSILVQQVIVGEDWDAKEFELEQLRPEQISGVIFKAQLRFVFVDLASKRPREIPEKIKKSLGIPDDFWFQENPRARDVGLQRR